MSEFNISTNILNSKLQNTNNSNISNESESEAIMLEDLNSPIDEELIASKFKIIVNDYYEILDKIELLKEHLTKLKKKKISYDQFMLKFASRQNIGELNTKQGKIRFTTSKQKPPLNFESLQRGLITFFNDSKKGNDIANHIMINRKPVERKRVKLTKKRIKSKE